MGKRKPVDESKLRTLALVGCSIETMARHLGVSRDTLERNYRNLIEQSRSDAQVQLLGKTFSSAMRGTTSDSGTDHTHASAHPWPGLRRR